MSDQNIEKRPPPVAWAERNSLLYLSINVTDCKKPEIKLDSKKLYFKGRNGDDLDFEVTLEFYKEINEQASRFSVKDRGIDFILKKAEEGPYWNRLLKDNNKYHWLKIDFTKWKDEDDSDVDNPDVDEDEMEEMMKKMSGLQSTNNDLNDLDTDEEEED
ncbi:hypothetical protein JTE90_006991 [Oedothorax gibbosus]|uniref:CS domain-containing protein n=1 Tax=Oedothorax gibbosus TaxID=931172 RepID=A0AAV6VAR6_9ARAC|nr:hypothetical protein JTE90_006991 [Oedothorax gibbosus]